MPRRNKVRLDALVSNKVIYSSVARTKYKTIAMVKMEKWVCLSSHHLTQGRRGLSLSQHWSVIRPHPVRQRKGMMCIVSPFDGVEAARLDLRYLLFSLTKLRRGRAFATCSLPRYGQIPAAGALLVTSRRPSGTSSSGLAPLPIFPHCYMWIFFICLVKTYLGRRTFHLLQSCPQTIFDKPPCCYLSLITWNMLLFCRRMCLQLVLLGSNCFLSTSH